MYSFEKKIEPYIFFKKRGKENVKKEKFKKERGRYGRGSAIWAAFAHVGLAHYKKQIGSETKP
jgi:hypothetical protein